MYTAVDTIIDSFNVILLSSTEAGNRLLRYAVIIGTLMVEESSGIHRIV